MKSPIQKLMIVITSVALTACSTSQPKSGETPEVKVSEVVTKTKLKASSRAPASNGKEGGNGGDAVVCPDGVYMLDSIESERRGYPIKIIGGKTLRSKVEATLGRLDSKNLVFKNDLLIFADIILKDIESYDRDGSDKQENTIFTDGNLINVSDEVAGYLPPKCTLEQLIVQNAKPMPGEKKFIFQKGLWNRMSMEEQAAAVIHESIFSFMIKYTIPNSLVTRYFNGLTISGQIQEYSVLEFLEFTETNGLFAGWGLDGFYWNQKNYRDLKLSVLADGSLDVQVLQRGAEGLRNNFKILNHIDLAPRLFNRVTFSPDGKWTFAQWDFVGKEYAFPSPADIRVYAFVDLEKVKVITIPENPFHEDRKVILAGTIYAACVDVEKYGLDSKHIIQYSSGSIQRVGARFELNAFRPVWGKRGGILNGMKSKKQRCGYESEAVKLILDQDLNVVDSIR
jgi:hypothetical protein